MSSAFGNQLKIQLFGQSHGPAIGVVADGFPAGETVDMERLQAFLARRKPGGALATKRKEEDQPVFLSGMLDGKTCGSPLCAIIENQDMRSGDYEALADQPRPSHADYTAFVKWGGAADMRGGGHFSGRLTAPLCIAGGIALQLLERKGVVIGARLRSVGGVEDCPLPAFPDRELLQTIARSPFPMLDSEAAALAREEIASAAKEGDSVGGVVECVAVGCKPGIGGPIFDGVESRLAPVLFGIPAVKGVEFGAGFASARKRGSSNNDPFGIGSNGEIRLEKNDAGGILGGITSGAPLVVSAAFKPTPSIAQPQKTVSLSRREEVELVIHGRHDPCVALRAVPVVEAAVALVLLDMYLEEE